ncbi:MAG: DNA recombination protein RmuC [Candidatus Aureabacteria bacterium]|nr:DNA recombination protein RmuC [Candidatus Auribacterota bacterium]
MQATLIILLILLAALTAAGFGAIFYLLNSLKSSQSRDESIYRLQGQVESLSQTFHERIHETNQSIQKQFTESIQIVKDVTEKLVRLDETNRQIVDHTLQLKKLEDILKSPKQRGILGEFFLESMLSQVFAPHQYKMQYSFPNGSVVDAAIFVKDKIIPVDAKFSLEKYEQFMNENDSDKAKSLEKDLKNDLKSRINETSKYVMPNHGTTDFAMMFIPAEGVFHQCLSLKIGQTPAGSSDLVEYAFSQKVIITSPTTFFAYLQTIFHSLKALQIEESVKEVIVRIRDLGRHMERFNDFMQKLGNNLSRTVGSYNSAYRELEKIDKDIVRLTDKEKGIDADLLDKPGMSDT